MTRRAGLFTLVLVGMLSIPVLCLPALCLAEIAAPPPGSGASRADRAARNRVGLRVARRVRPRPNPIPTGPPPVRQVRTALRGAQPAIQACATQYPPPGTGRTRRMRVRVWLYPTGRWTMEVPELTQRRPGQPAQSHAALRSCMRAAISTRIQGHMRRFRGRTRQKVERAFRVRMPGPPPSEAELGRRVTRRRRQLLACVPGAGRQGDEAQITIRATLETTGRVTLTGLGLPDGVPFGVASSCVSTALAPVTTDAVTTPRSFETTLRFRYRAPAQPAVPAQPAQPLPGTIRGRVRGAI